ncbi:response regulator [Sporichthya sp.]|uniref:response regulator n=1 Tax=Sporichthya sp. TaxID=65475 RepID=UPI00182D7346|nr:response regulator [Sporichthya sp.]MBA3741903.1 response regulator [Sporichthya sp.]
MQIVLIEDDPGDATLVRDMLDEVEPDLSLTWVRSIAEAGPALSAETRCVLLDLVLPDATGFDGLQRVLAQAPNAAVVVLTGFSDSDKGVEAVSRGAQDYLNKSQIDPELLSRAVRYAVERRAAQDTARELAQAESRAAENTRLERGLLPKPLLFDANLAVVQRYRPGRDRALLGGDFYDVVECADGVLYAVIGDVSGHGPDEAALGVCLCSAARRGSPRSWTRFRRPGSGGARTTRACRSPRSRRPPPTRNWRSCPRSWAGSASMRSAPASTNWPRPWRASASWPGTGSWTR